MSLGLLAITDDAYLGWRARLDSPAYAQAVAEAHTALRGPGAATTIVPGRKNAGSIALISLTGFMTQKPSIESWLFGGTSTVQFAAAVVAALRDPAISAVVMVIDSPGGSVFGLTEAAAAIRAARGSKPLLAVADPMAGSAAYYLAAQVDPGSLIVTPSGVVGSIGSMLEHVELSDALAKNGIRVTVIKYGKNKAEGHPAQPLGEDAAAHMQAIVDSFGRGFEADVAKGRGISVEKVRNDYGQGMMFTASAALAAGLVDEIATLDDVVARLARQRVVPGGQGGAGSTAVVAGELRNRVAWSGV